ncbi:CUE domain-containing protein 4, mitochondrial [Erysiphe neolycopersici]|uniref:Coupling of ubiquitin conjugation to ER degradation protein 1 n=1 Tax=Erysiphe neolycopersici TaxID=212602 RepID=A0A420HD22_9PEZI|nr:CUE domain-containing protein 4, mitochondrial [Erysiphe neolycopersici]
MAEQSFGFPQLILIFLVGGLTIRYFFFSSGLSSSTSRGTNNAIDLRAREADVERVQQMFPQVSRRSIMWDLQRNGGNVAATIERVLTGRGLEDPPQSFQPSLPVSSSQSTTESSSHPITSPSHPDLITRYDLRAKIIDQKPNTNESGNPVEQGPEAKRKESQAWSTNKSERQALLQRRREEMILAARRKMEAKIAAEATKVKD